MLRALAVAAYVATITGDPAADALLRRFRLPFEGRSLNTSELSYEVQMPFDASTDPVSHGIVALSPKTDMGVEWTDKKPKTK